MGRLGSLLTLALGLAIVVNVQNTFFIATYHPNWLDEDCRRLDLLGWNNHEDNGQHHCQATKIEGRAPSKPLDLTQDSIDWPLEPPVVDTGCKVRFREENMATCHVGAFGGNFGDLLGPSIVKRLLEYHTGCSAEALPVWDMADSPFRNNTEETYEARSTTCLWSVGSVWTKVRPNDHVWGTGTHGYRREFRTCLNQTTVDVHFHGVRGPKTVERMQKFCGKKLTTSYDEIATHGDAGFLIPFLFPEYKVNPESAVKCYIEHYYDEGKQRTIPADAIALPVIQPWQTMVGNMTQCQQLVSSSLHGVILGDAFGIPTRWVTASSSVLPFKFQDYFASLKHNKPPFTSFEEALSDTADWPEVLSSTERSSYARRIVQNFPFDLFTTETLTASTSL